jgi:hypothetical protein
MSFGFFTLKEKKLSQLAKSVKALAMKLDAQGMRYEVSEVKPRVIYFAKRLVGGYMDPTEPNKYPELYSEFVDKSAYDKLAAENEQLKYQPGHLECKKCGFGLVKNYINLNSGRISANSSPQDCANGCGPMWKIARADFSKRLMNSLDSATDKIKELKAENERLTDFLDGRCMKCLGRSQPFSETNHCADCVEEERIREVFAADALKGDAK